MGALRDWGEGDKGLYVVDKSLPGKSAPSCCSCRGETSEIDSLASGAGLPTKLPSTAVIP